MERANEKASLENQTLLAPVGEWSQIFHSKNEVHNEKLLVLEHKDLELLLEEIGSELLDVRAELTLLKVALL